MENYGSFYTPRPKCFQCFLADCINEAEEGDRQEDICKTDDEGQKQQIMVQDEGRQIMVQKIWPNWLLLCQAEPNIHDDYHKIMEQCKIEQYEAINFHTDYQFNTDYQMLLRRLEGGERPQMVQIRSDKITVFSGWMFASSPAVSALEHPVYDVTLLACAK